MRPLLSLLASVDGLRFVVPTKSVNTGPSPKRYGHKRGVTRVEIRQG